MALTFVKGKQAQDHFETLLAATSLIPFVGAGFSFGPCPGWGQFLDKLYEQIKPSMTPEEIESYNLLKQGTTAADFEALLDLLFTCEGKGKGDRLVQSIFDVDIKHPFKTALEHKFGLFHQAFKGPWITTNLDRFIEKTYPADHTAIYGNDAPRLQSHLTNADSAGLLLKIHGDVKEPSSWVLSKQHYDHAYGCEQGVDLNAPLPKFLARLYTNHTLLFIGCSLQDDRPLKVLEQLMEIHGARQHFALLLEPKITNKKKDKHKKKEHTLFKRRLSNLNITPIWLDSFDDINTVLSQLGPNAEEPKQIAEVKTSVESPNIFVGREKEIKQLTSALKKPGSVHAVSGGGQLLHLTGIGGIGKTTLAREALSRCKDQFSDGCFEIRLAGLSPQSFTMQLAARLQLKIPEPSSAANAQQVISDLLNKYRLLILLDNVLDSKE
ncbi:MAG: SIR2 family protein, partial [Algicola sp.]|nr:SIR2 family protein [Algicola sp.]